jgi:hypothetical protein
MSRECSARCLAVRRALPAKHGPVYPMPPATIVNSEPGVAYLSWWRFQRVALIVTRHSGIHR